MKIGTAFFTLPVFGGFVLLIIIAYIANLLVVQRGDVSNTLLLSFFHPPSRRRYKTLQAYLLSVIDDNKDLRQQPQLTGAEAEEILTACVDRRRISEDKVASLGNNYSVGQVGWETLDHQWNLHADAMVLLIRELGHQDAIICAAAARMIKTHSIDFTTKAEIRAAVTHTIIDILNDEVLSRRPLNTPDYIVWRLDDVLFDTLQALMER